LLLIAIFSILDYIVCYITNFVCVSHGFGWQKANREQGIGEQILRSPQGAEKKRKSKWQKQTGVNKSTLSLIENGRSLGSLDILERYSRPGRLP